MAGTTPVTVCKKVVSSSKGIGDSWAPYLISLAPSVGMKFFRFTFENVNSINFCFGWSLIPIPQPCPRKSKLLQPPSRSSPGRIRR